MTASVLVLGDVLVDELWTSAGSVDVAGGSALNVAVGLAVLGVPAVLAGVVGEDESGDLLRRHAAEHGVTLLTTTAPLGTGRAVSDRTAGEPRYSFLRPLVPARSCRPMPSGTQPRARSLWSSADSPSTTPRKSSRCVP